MRVDDGLEFGLGRGCFGGEGICGEFDFAHRFSSDVEQASVGEELVLVIEGKDRPGEVVLVPAGPWIVPEEAPVAGTGFHPQKLGCKTHAVGDPVRGKRFPGEVGEGWDKV